MAPRPRQASLNHTLAGANCPRNGTDTDNAQALLSLSLSLVEAALEILSHHLTSDKQLQRQSILMPGGSVGKHFRHVIETYRAFLLPLRGQANGPITVNYDAILPPSRKSIARSLGACEMAMQEVYRDLRSWGQMSSSLRGNGDAAAVGDGGVGEGVAGETRERGLVDEFKREVKLVALTPTKQEMRSSVGRELWFCALHAIHHFSMLRTIAVHELGLDLPIEFGTAPSTLLYRDKDWRPPVEQAEVRSKRRGAGRDVRSKL